MATNKNALVRIKILDELLSSKWLTLDELTDEVNDRLKAHDCQTVTKDCIRKDFDYLENYSPWMYEGYSDYSDKPEDNTLIERKWETVSNPEKNGMFVSFRLYHYRKKGFSIFKQKLSAEEQELLSAALGIIGEFEGLPIFTGLDNLKKSLHVDPQERVVSLAVNPLADSTLLAELYLAIKSKTAIELSYFLFGAPDEIKSVIIHPYLLKEYNRRWYVIGAADDTMRILNFALDRISSIKQISTPAYKPAPIDLNEWCEDVIGVTVMEDSPVYNIQFWVGGRSKYYVESKPLHPSQKRIHTNEAELQSQYPHLRDGWFFSIDCRMNYELVRELTSFGDELIVLSPNEVKGKVVKRIEDMYKKYFTLVK